MFKARTRGCESKIGSRKIKDSRRKIQKEYYNT